MTYEENLNHLQSLLEKQIEMVCRGDFSRIELLTEQAGSTVEEIIKIPPGKPEFDARRKHLMKLYKKLELMLAAGKASVEKQIRQIGDIRKTIEAYRNSS